MNEAPRTALRKSTSVYEGCRLLKENRAQVYVTSCNTGALVTAAVRYLKMLPGVKRPGLAVVYTKLQHKKKGNALFLDVGACIETSSEQIVSHATLGAHYLALQGIENPRVGLLNIGQEEHKGSSRERDAFALLSRLPINFKGNVEPSALFSDEVDVIVTSGMFGNLCLKTIEAFKPALKQLYPIAANTMGAVLLGVDGHVVKCHGAATGEEMGLIAIQAATQIEAIQQLRANLKLKVNPQKMLPDETQRALS